MDRARALRLAESMTGKGNETRFALFLRLFDLFMARAARAGVMGPGPEAVAGEAALFARIAPHQRPRKPWPSWPHPVGPRAARARGEP